MWKDRAMASVLFVTWPGGGNVTPLLALGAQLIERGHDVRVVGVPELAPRFEAAGVAYACPEDDLAAEIERAATDVVIVDYMQPLALSVAEASGRPVVAYVHTLYSSQAVTDHSPIHMGGDVATVNARRAELGLDPVVRVPDLVDRADLVMVTTTEDFDGPDQPVPAKVKFVGPIVEDKGPNTPWEPPFMDDAPLVVVALGSTPMGEEETIVRVLDALADEPVHVFVTVGDHLDPGDFADVPGNAIVASYVRHAAVLPFAAVFVTHAGLSGIGAAMSCGVPMVCVPLGREQPDNAARVEAVGLGRIAGPGDDLRVVVREVLADNTMREHAAHMRDSLDPTAAVRAIESLLG
jgi:MGT family glycosyltransferase